MESGSVHFEERLERGELLSFGASPFALPTGDDLAFLLRQRLRGFHKNISYNPATHTLSGLQTQAPAQVQRLQLLMQRFSEAAATWLTQVLPRYASYCQADRASFRPDEEAVRRLRPTARNDLLHFDAFPSRPTHGQRILRLFVNVNPTDERVWVTSDTFARLLERFGTQVGLPSASAESWVRRFSGGLLGLLQPGHHERSAYDSFMLRFHHFLKTNDSFQESAPRRFWRFPPGMCWLIFGDAVSHAELRGQYALEHSFFIAPEGLALPELAPPALLQAACGRPVLHRAA